MKVVICSLAGSVGKTTVTAHLLHPRMPVAKIYAVDTTNATAAHFGIEVEAFSGDEFSKLYKQIVRNDDLIIDVGGSKEGKEFLTGMDWVDGQDEIDAFIIPSMPDDKDQKAAVKTIELLLAQNVDKNKIKTIFNAVKKNTVDEFDYLLGALTVNQIPYSLDATIFSNEMFNILSTYGRNLDSILKDSTDYKNIVRTSDDEDEITRASDLMIAQKAAPKVNENLNTVYQALFPAVKKAAKAPAKDKE
jgi:hypothetical protein